MITFKDSHPDHYVACSWNDVHRQMIRFWSSDWPAEKYDLCPVADFQNIRAVCHRLGIPVMFEFAELSINERLPQ